jgi:hypothetical protein
MILMKLIIIFFLISHQKLFDHQASEHVKQFSAFAKHFYSEEVPPFTPQRFLQFHFCTFTFFHSINCFLHVLFCKFCIISTHFSSKCYEIVNFTLKCQTNSKFCKKMPLLQVSKSPSTGTSRQGVTLSPVFFPPRKLKSDTKTSLRYTRDHWKARKKQIIVKLNSGATNQG